jgi:hypothetical protein
MGSVKKLWRFFAIRLTPVSVTVRDLQAESTMSRSDAIVPTGSGPTGSTISDQVEPIQEFVGHPRRRSWRFPSR